MSKIVNCDYVIETVASLSGLACAVVMFAHACDVCFGSRSVLSFLLLPLNPFNVCAKKMRREAVEHKIMSDLLTDRK